MISAVQTNDICRAITPFLSRKAMFPAVIKYIRPSPVGEGTGVRFSLFHSERGRG